MAPYVTEVLLWLFVVNHGVAFGAGLQGIHGGITAHSVVTP